MSLLMVTYITDNEMVNLLIIPDIDEEITLKTNQVKKLLLLELPF